MFHVYQEELEKFRVGKSSYEWDELEELITDAFGEEKLTSEEYDRLMKQLMELDCD